MSYFDDVIEPALLRDPPRKRREQTIIADDISDDKEFTWTTKDGRKYPISLMTDEHLYNAYRHVQTRPRPPRWGLGLVAFFDDEDLAVAMLEQEWENAKKRTLKQFQKEADRRGLGELF